LSGLIDSAHECLFLLSADSPQQFIAA